MYLELGNRRAVNESIVSGGKRQSTGRATDGKMGADCAVFACIYHALLSLADPNLVPFFWFGFVRGNPT